MIIIRYVDIYKTIETPEGLVDVLTVKDATLPIIINPDRVGLVQPYVSSKGKMFKNVSYITHDGEVIKIVGNFKVIDNLIKEHTNKRMPIQGFKNDIK